MEIFDNLEQHIQNPLVLQSILGLMERGTLVLTTNYDNLLELFGQQQNKPMESLDLKDKTKVWPRKPLPSAKMRLPQGSQTHSDRTRIWARPSLRAFCIGPCSALRGPHLCLLESGWEMGDKTDR